jgi:hypothetical protein
VYPISFLTQIIVEDMKDHKFESIKLVLTFLMQQKVKPPVSEHEALFFIANKARTPTRTAIWNGYRFVGKNTT